MFSTDPNHQLTLRQGTLHFQQVDQLSFQTTQAASHRRYLWSVQWIPMIPVCNSDCLLPFSKKAQYLDQTCESWTIGPGQKLIFLPVLCLYMSISIHFCTFPHFLIIAFWGSQSQIASDRMPMQQCALYIYIYMSVYVFSLYISIYWLWLIYSFIYSFIYLSYSCVYLFICVNYTISLAWIVRPFGDDFPYWPWCVYSPLHPGAEIHPAAAPLLSVAWPAGFARPAPPPLGPASIQGKSAMLMFSLDHSFKYARSIKYNII